MKRLSVWLAGITVAALLISVIVVWQSNRHWFEITDVVTPISITSRAPESSWMHVTAISVQVSGEIDGDAEIWADGWTRQRISGKVDWAVYRDWYTSDFTLHYRPISAKTGKLLIKYQFH